METREVSVPYIIEDFSPGDRVYRVHEKDGDMMGRVTSASGKYVIVTMDNGQEKRIRLSSFDKKPKRMWGKALDIESLSAGDRISLGGYGKPRMYATIISFSQEREMILDMEIPGLRRSVQTYHDSTHLTLDWWFAKWELEG